MSVTYFTEILKTLRKQAGLTQAALSEAIDVSVRQVQLLESGNAEPSYRCILNLSRVFDVNPSVFFSSSNCDFHFLDQIDSPIHATDTKGIITYVNLSHARMLKRSREEIIGTSIYDFFAQQDEIPGLKKFVEFVIDSHPLLTPYVTFYKCASGNPIPIEIDWSYLYCDKGEVVGFLSVVRKRE